MKKRDTSYALEYHQATKHSEISLRTSGHYLDWENKPFPFKVYEGLLSTPLPKHFPRPEADALDCISGLKAESKTGPLGIAELAELLFFSAGLTRGFRHGGEIHYMRAAPATGALYPIELYVICRDIEGLDAGVYHFNPLDFSLVQIRAGDWRAELAAMSDESISSAPATIGSTSFAWRNAWKYEARSYRHWFWDGGVIAANLLAVSASMGLEARILAGFVDASVNHLLAVKDGKEATVFLAPVGLDHKSPTGRTIKTAEMIAPKVRPLSRNEAEHPEIWKLHQASSLRDPNEVKAWVQNRQNEHVEEKPLIPTFPLVPKQAGSSNREKLRDVILQRGSTRRFARSPISLAQLGTILRSSTRPLPLDYLGGGERLIDVYLVANAVDDLPSGSYFFDPGRDQLAQLKTGQLRRMSAYLCLEQSLFGDASAVFFLMTRLGEVLKRFGNRGYRAAQLEGGIIAGKVYLSAYSLDLGASGTTFYDDAVTEFFSPHAKEKITMIAVATGVPAYKARSGRVLPQFPENIR